MTDYKEWAEKRKIYRLSIFDRLMKLEWRHKYLQARLNACQPTVPSFHSVMQICLRPNPGNLRLLPHFPAILGTFWVQCHQKSVSIMRIKRIGLFDSD